MSLKNLRSALIGLLTVTIAAANLVVSAQSASATSQAYGITRWHATSEFNWGLWNGIEIADGEYLTGNDGEFKYSVRDSAGLVVINQTVSLSGLRTSAKWVTESATSVWVSAGRNVHNLVFDGTSWTASSAADCNSSDDTNSTPMAILKNPNGGVFVVYRDGKFVSITANGSALNCTDLVADLRGGMPEEATRIQDAIAVSNTSIFVVEFPYNYSQSWLREIRLVNGTWTPQERISLIPENMNETRSWNTWEDWYSVLGVDPAGALWVTVAGESRTWLQKVTNVGGTWTKGDLLNLNGTNVANFEFLADGTLVILRNLQDLQLVQPWELSAGAYTPTRDVRLTGGLIYTMQPDATGGVMTIGDGGLRHIAKAQVVAPTFGTFDNTMTASTTGGRTRLPISATGFPLPSFYLRGELPEVTAINNYRGLTADLDVEALPGSAGTYNAILGARNAAGTVETPITITVTGTTLPLVFGTRVVSSNQAPSSSASRIVSTDSDAIWQSNPSAGMVTRYSLGSDNTFTKIASVPVGTNPGALTLDADGESVWVANRGSGTVQRVTGSGSSWSAESAIAVGSSASSAPADISFDASGDLWVALTGESAIQSISNGVAGSVLPVTGAGATSVNVILGSTDELFVSRGSNKLARFTKSAGAWSQQADITININPTDIEQVTSTRILVSSSNTIQEITFASGAWTLNAPHSAYQAKRIEAIDATNILSGNSFLTSHVGSGDRNNWARNQGGGDWQSVEDLAIISGDRVAVTQSNGVLRVYPYAQPITPSFSGSTSATLPIGYLAEVNIPTTQNSNLWELISSEPLPTGLGLRINNGVAQIYGTPTNPADEGQWTFELRLRTGATHTASHSYSLTMVNPPTITSSPVARFQLGQASTFVIRTTQLPDLSITSGSMPDGFTFVDNGNGTATISGTPASGSIGDNIITVSADNGTGTIATQDLTIRVAGQDPQLSWTPITTIELPQEVELDPSEFATAVSSGPITYELTPNGLNDSSCGISAGGRISTGHSGTCYLRANIGQYGNYEAAYVDVVFTIVKDATPIVWQAQDVELPVDSTVVPAILPTIYAGVDVTYSVISGSGTTSDCAISDQNVLELTVTTLGTCTVRAHTNGTDRVEAQDVDVVLNIVLGNRNMVWTPTTTTVALLTGSFAPTPRATTQGPGAITYSVYNAGTTACKVNTATGQITFGKTGVCRIKAQVAAQGTWAAGSRIVNINIVGQQIQVGTTIRAEKVVPKAFATNQGKSLPVGKSTSYSVSGAACSIKGSTITAKKIGTCTVTATVGSVSWSAPLEVEEFLVAIGKTATGSGIAAAFDREWITGATATITVASASANVCSSNGTKVTALKGGSCKVTVAVQQPREKKTNTITEYQVIKGKRTKVKRVVVTYGPWPAIQRWTETLQIAHGSR